MKTPLGYATTCGLVTCRGCWWMVAVIPPSVILPLAMVNGINNTEPPIWADTVLSAIIPPLYDFS